MLVCRQQCLYFLPLPHGQREFLPVGWLDTIVLGCKRDETGENEFEGNPIHHGAFGRIRENCLASEVVDLVTIARMFGRSTVWEVLLFR